MNEKKTHTTQTCLPIVRFFSVVAVCPLPFAMLCALRPIHNVRAHIIWFEVHLIKFYMIISSHFDDHQLRLGVLVTLGLVLQPFRIFDELFFMPLFVSLDSSECVFFSCHEPACYLSHSCTNLEHFPLHSTIKVLDQRIVLNLLPITKANVQNS